MDTDRRDSGSIVLGWLTKVIVVVALSGLVLFDGISVGVVRMSASDDANNAASAAAEEWSHTHNIQLAYDAALKTITNPNEALLTRGFSIDPNGTAHVLLRRTTTTLLLYRIGPLKKYATTTARGEAPPPTL